MNHTEFALLQLKAAQRAREMLDEFFRFYENQAALLAPQQQEEEENGSEELQGQAERQLDEDRPISLW